MLFSTGSGVPAASSPFTIIVARRFGGGCSEILSFEVVVVDFLMTLLLL